MLKSFLGIYFPGPGLPIWSSVLHYDESIKDRIPGRIYINSKETIKVLPGYITGEIFHTTIGQKSKTYSLKNHFIELLLTRGIPFEWIEHELPFKENNLIPSGMNDKREYIFIVRKLIDDSYVYGHSIGNETCALLNVDRHLACYHEVEILVHAGKLLLHYLLSCDRKHI